MINSHACMHASTNEHDFQPGLACQTQLILLMADEILKAIWILITMQIYS